ncbi:MAG: hypothetical protein HY072_05620 [Deltaproteobacteria bacterium]|nr:hypothetical protein [Deltaproteobacteria bacterium]
MKKNIIVLLSVLMCSYAYSFARQELEDDFMDMQGDEALAPPAPIIIPFCLRADLIVKALPNPNWDDTNRQSVIQVVIKNIGTVSTVLPFQVRLIADGVVYNQNTLPLAAGMSRTLIFRLPYWIYNPDANYTAIVDSIFQIKECNEQNNSKSFFGIG